MGIPTKISSLLDRISNLQEKVDALQSLQNLDQLTLEIKKKDSPVSLITKSLLELSEEEKKEAGTIINEQKRKLLERIKKREEELKKDLSILPSEAFDLTLPSPPSPLGSLHPLTLVQERIVDIFGRMGFEIMESRLVDDYFHVFASLNFRADHPATDIMDTLWTESKLIPIPHTSSMQNRVLKEKPPLAKVIVGRCMRFEATDPRHEHTFHQLEGVFIDRNIKVSDLIGTLKAFLESFFEQKLKIKIQPSFFPFVEPALEIMAECIFCQSRGCETCSGSGFLELIPSGMVHPNVLKMAEIDPLQYNGFAWAIGIDRLAMLLYGINDIRLFHSGDLRFLRQF